MARPLVAVPWVQWFGMGAADFPPSAAVPSHPIASHPVAGRAGHSLALACAGIPVVPGCSRGRGIHISFEAVSKEREGTEDAM